MSPRDRSGRGPPPRVLRPLNLPRPVRVEADGEGLPRRLYVGARWRRVAAVRERWRIADEWWRRPIEREYASLLLEDGKTVTVYRDLLAGGWFAQEA